MRPGAVDDQTPLAAIVSVADRRTEQQLVRGFHRLESAGWRWTAGRFTVTLQPPGNAASNGAVLLLKFTLPPPVVDRVKSVTLTPAINGAPLAPQTYDKAGEHSYRAEVPPMALSGSPVSVEFTLDHFLKAGEVEDRELGLIVSVIGLEAR